MHPTGFRRIWHTVGGTRTLFQFAELISRKSDWDATSLAGLAGGNLLQVVEGVEQVAQQMQKGGIKRSWQLRSGKSGQGLLGKTYRHNTLSVQVRVPMAIQSIKWRRNEFNIANQPEQSACSWQ